MIQLKGIRTDSGEKTITVDTLPSVCPYCKMGISPVFLAGNSRVKMDYKIRIAFLCPIESCSEIFSARYTNNAESPTGGMCRLDSVDGLTYSISFKAEEIIEEISPNYCRTFSQSLIAEANSLDQVAGPGFRKSLEFLIKDFLIGYAYEENEEKQETVKKLLLGNCIANHIDDDRIKECAERAAWIGNDETHYTRKWDDKDIGDLKKLILMTSNWISLVVHSDRFKSEMPKDREKPS